jgi:hypothetical protein
VFESTSALSRGTGVKFQRSWAFDGYLASEIPAPIFPSRGLHSMFVQATNEFIICGEGLLIPRPFPNFTAIH